MAARISKPGVATAPSFSIRDTSPAAAAGASKLSFPVTTFDPAIREGSSGLMGGMIATIPGSFAWQF